VYLDVNDSFLEWTGYTREEVIGRTSIELQLWAEPDRNREFRRLLHEQGNVHNFEYAFRRKDDTLRYALVSATFITIGGEQCLLAQSNDITDRKQAEEAFTNTHLRLQQSLKFTEALLSAIPTPVFYKDRQGRYMGCNRAFSEVMGVTLEEIKGKTVFELWPGEHAGIYHAKDLELMNNPVRQTYEFMVRDKDGLERPVVYVRDVFRDESDQVAGIVGAFLDITERKQAEEALRRLNRELRAISDCNQTLLRAVDEQTLLNDICRIVCDEAGYRMAWVGYAEQDDAQTVRPVAWAGVEDGYLATANITWVDTERGRGSTGTAIRSGESAGIQDFATEPRANPWRENALQRGYRSNIALPLKDESAHTFGALTIYSTETHAFTPDEVRLLEELAGDLAFGITTLRTRAERKRAEDALWESSQMLQLVLENIPAYVFWKDRDCVYLGCNTLSAVNSGLSSPQDIVGLTDFDLPWKDTHAELYRADDRQVMETGLPKLNYEETQLTADGRVITLRTSKVPLRNPAGDVIGVLGMFEDITERKQAEAALWESSQMLKLVLDHMPAYVFWKDLDSVYLGCNHLFAANAGLSSPENIAGLTDFDLPWRDAEAKAYQADDRLVMETGLPKLNYEETQLVADGRLTAVRTSKVPLRNPAGDIIGVLGTFEDITERKRTEEALRESQALYRSFIEQLPNPVFRKDSAGRYVMVNAKFCQLKGVTAEDFLGKTPTEVARREWAKQGESGQAVKYAVQSEEIHDLIMRTGQVVEMVEEHAIADGGKQCMHVIRMPVFDSEGKIVGTQGIQFDITERVRAEEALQENEARYRLLAENASDVIFTLGLDLRFTYVSPSVTRIRGYSVEETMAQSLDQVLTPDSLAVASQAFAEEMALEASGSQAPGRTRTLELEEVRRDGSTIWTETTVAFLRDSTGQASGLIGITRDITERKRAEEEIYTLNQELEQRVIVRTAELARAHERLRAILDTAGEGVVFTDLHGTIEYINPAMERLTGYQATETIGRNPRIWKSNQTPPATHRQMWSALTSGEIWQGELINRRKDGTLYDAALTTAPLTNPEGHIVGFVGVQRDISRQKELDRLKDQFVSNVSHELRTPLANILLHVGLLEHGKPDKLGSYLQTLRREAERLRKLIEDLLDLSRLDRNVVPIQLAPVDLHHLLEQLVTDRAALAEQHGLTLTYTPAPDLPLVLADTSKLIQVASNLLTNALNYTPAGGSVSVAVDVREHEGKQLAAFTVRDTGPGISRQDMAHLFERFYRGASGRQASAPGTGLGLAISQEIARRLNGRITVASEVGQGAAFTVWLPIV
jgi:PAS domain S-box-containing protein